MSLLRRLNSGGYTLLDLQDENLADFAFGNSSLGPTNATASVTYRVSSDKQIYKAENITPSLTRLQTWLSGADAGAFSGRYILNSSSGTGTPTVFTGITTGAFNTWYPLSANLTVSHSVTAVAFTQNGIDSDAYNGNVSIQIARTGDTGNILKSAYITISLDAQVEGNL